MIFFRHHNLLDSKSPQIQILYCAEGEGYGLFFDPEVMSVNVSAKSAFTQRNLPLLLLSCGLEVPLVLQPSHVFSGFGMLWPILSAA